jgi:hypothetical protein
MLVNARECARKSAKKRIRSTGASKPSWKGQHGAVPIFGLEGKQLRFVKTTRTFFLQICINLTSFSTRGQPKEEVDDGVKLPAELLATNTWPTII